MPPSIFCEKLQKNAPPLECPPFPGVLGEKIYHHISKPAWSQWVAHQTMLINECRLNTADPKARQFLKTEMEKFLFGAK